MIIKAGSLDDDDDDDDDDGLTGRISPSKKDGHPIETETEWLGW